MTTHPTIYLDNNATTRPDDAVAAAVDEVQRTLWHNPSSIHRPGQAARARIELARRELADLIGTRPRFLTLTGSGTEAIDLAIRGALLAQGRIGANRRREPGVLVTTRVEHSGVRELAEALHREEGIRVAWADLAHDGSGTVDVAALGRTLDAPEIRGLLALVSVQWANNETGAVQSVHEVGRLCRERGVLFHCDATQWVGRMETRVDGAGADGTPPLAVDLLTFSPHKFHGPKGVGVLYARAGVRTAPLIHGEQELGRRGGTENVAGIVGAGVAARLAQAWLADPEGRRRVARLRDRFEAAVLAGVPDARVNGPTGGWEGTLAGNPGRLWNATSIGFPRLEAEALLLLLSERGVCASAGAACSSGSLEPSSVLLAMGVPPEYAHGSLRFSLSRETTEEEVERGAALVVECVRRLKKSMDAVEGGERA